MKQMLYIYTFLISSISHLNLGIANGYPCFVISIFFIGACTAVIGDVAGHLGCFIFLKDSVNAIAFVALGTSVPGTFENCFSHPLPPVPPICHHNVTCPSVLIFEFFRHSLPRRVVMLISLTRQAYFPS